VDAVQAAWAERRHVAGRAAADVEVGIHHGTYPFSIPLI
jgi:hypothetical protein